MNRILSLLGVVLLVAGCSRTPSTAERDWQRYYASRTPSSASTHACVAKAGPNCRAKILWQCPDGFVDGCDGRGTSGVHQCVARTGGALCAERVELKCAAGFEDGCRSGRSATHECMPVPSTTACAQAMDLRCPENFVDACAAKQ